MTRFCAALLLLLVAGAALIQGSRLPSLDGREDDTVTTVFPGQSPVVDSVRLLALDHPGNTGLHALRSGVAAFEARLALIDAARHSLDVQYYIWHADMTGSLLLDALRRAADRGVHVRLLLDDNNTGGMDRILAALDHHPGIEVRLFNPFAQRRLRMLGYLTDFPRLNRRMHNKSMTADGALTILGGRNVGDEYFAAGSGFEFVDLDVIAIGGVVRDVVASFDKYWRSGSSYPVSWLAGPATETDLSRLAALGQTVAATVQARRYAATLPHRHYIDELLEGRLVLVWAPAAVVVDPPEKALQRIDAERTLIERMRALRGGRARGELDLVSPYFVPLDAGSRHLADLASRGARVRILTNALEATDVAAVHAGYAKHRRELVEAGVQLYEMRRLHAGPATQWSTRGSSSASLHAKTIAMDGRWLFIGSFNYDPRSFVLNTEIGLLVDSPQLARQMSSNLDRVLPGMSYRVQLDADGGLQWVEQRQDGTQVHHPREPNVGAGQRLLVGFLSLLPIDSLL